MQLSISAHGGNVLKFMALHIIAVLMTIISYTPRTSLGEWQTRKTRTMPMKTMARLSSCLRRACCVVGAVCVRDI